MSDGELKEKKKKIIRINMHFHLIDKGIEDELVVSFLIHAAQVFNSSGGGSFFWPVRISHSIYFLSFEQVT